MDEAGQDCPSHCADDGFVCDSVCYLPLMLTHFPEDLEPKDFRESLCLSPACCLPFLACASGLPCFALQDDFNSLEHIHTYMYSIQCTYQESRKM